MEDIRREDRRLFLKELATPFRVITTAFFSVVVYALLLASQNHYDNSIPWPAFMGAVFVIFVSACLAWNVSMQHRFRNKQMQALWSGCEERLRRFDEVLKRMRKDQVADLHEMPRTIHEVGEALYLALRRADMIADEVHASERGMYSQPPVWEVKAHDPQSKELYRLADKNIAEYRAQFAGVLAGVERTEAQSAVFMTTLDTLRMKMLGYRLVGRSPELSSHDFLEALAEARAQLQAIDTALEELDLGHYPKNISVVPPPIPEDVQAKLRLGE